MTFDEWCKTNKKLKLLALYDDETNPKKSFEISYSSGKPCWCLCPDCGRRWKTSPNKLCCLAEKEYNYYKRTKSLTYCVACGGKEASYFYNLKTETPVIDEYYDYDKNDKRPEDYTPRSTARIFIKCNNKLCEYRNKVRINDFVRRIHTYKCPECQGGKKKKATERHNLKVIAPGVAKEFDVRLNEGETADQILPSLRRKKWFTCEVCNHSYPARVSNRVYLGRGCPECNKKNQTSFIEQMFYFYISKCMSSAKSRAIDTHTDLEIDIFLPEKLLAIEYKSKYFYEKASPKRKEAYAKKLMKLTKYYQVISLQEYENDGLDDMIEFYVLPVFTHNQKMYQIYNNIVRDFLIKLFPGLPHYPSVDIERDSLQILQLYVKTKIKKSFEDTHPNYIKTWDNDMNGSLKPNMFTAGNSQFKFHWKCLNCKNNFCSSIYYRKRIAYDKCPKCNNEKPGDNMMSEYINIIRPFWNEKMNKVKLNDLSRYSEETIILQLYDGRCVPVKCYNLFCFIEKNPKELLEIYLEKIFIKRHSNKPQQSKTQVENLRF